MYHHRTLDELFLEAGPVELASADAITTRPLPSFGRVHRARVPATEWEATDRVPESVRLAAPSREECAALGGFYPSEERAAEFDCFLSAACAENRGCWTDPTTACPLECPHPRAPAPPDPPAAAVVTFDPCPAGDWHPRIPLGAVHVKPGAASGDGSMASPFGTIAEALEAAPDGGTIALARGRHAAAAITKSIALSGACTEGTTIEGLTSVGTASLTIERARFVGSGVELTDTFASLRQVAVEDTSGLGISARGAAIGLEGISVMRASGIGIELVGVVGTVSDVIVRDTAIAFVDAVPFFDCVPRVFGDASIGVLIACTAPAPEFVGCPRLDDTNPQILVNRLEISGPLNRMLDRYLWVGDGGIARLRDVTIRSEPGSPPTGNEGRGLYVADAGLADVQRILISGANHHAVEIRGSASIDDAEIDGALLGFLNSEITCIARVRILDALALGMCLDIDGSLTANDVEIVRPVARTAFSESVGNLCFDGATEVGSGIRVHQGSILDLHRFRLADGTDSGILLSQLAGTRVTITDGVIENNAISGAKVPTPPNNQEDPFPLERLMIRVRYLRNGEPFSF
jgi:hypothetical protein